MALVPLSNKYLMSDNTVVYQGWCVGNTRWHRHILSGPSNSPNHKHNPQGLAISAYTALLQGLHTLLHKTVEPLNNQCSSMVLTTQQTSLVPRLSCANEKVIESWAGPGTEANHKLYQHCLQKWERPGNSDHVNDVRWMWGGCRGAVADCTH